MANTNLPDLSAMTDEQLDAAIAEPLDTSVDLNEMQKDIELYKKYGDRALEAGSLAAADAATFSLSSRALQAAGLYTEEELRELRDKNPTADSLGTITGILGPAILSGGTTAAAKGATSAAGMAAKALSAPVQGAIKLGQVAEKGTSEIIGRVLGQAANKQMAKSVLRKSIEKGVGGSFEGAALATGQLLREDALGEADFNAENLLTTVGTGALYGGLANAAIPGITAAIGGTAKGGKYLFDKTMSKYADPVKAAEELTGFSPSKMEKLNTYQSGKELLQELPSWYVNEAAITVSDDAAAIYKKVKAAQRNAGRQIEGTLNQIDEVAATRISAESSSPNLRRQLLSNISKNIEDEFYTPYKDVDPLRAQSNRVKKVMDYINREANKPEALTGKALTNIKRKLDETLNAFYEGVGTKRKISEKAAFRGRDLINQATEKYAQYIDPDLAATLKKANRDYHIAAEIEKPLLKKALKDKEFLGFKDALYAATGSILGGGPLGAAVVVGKKFMESDLRRRLAILSGMEKANFEVAKKIGQATTNFFSKSGSAVKAASLNALISSPLSHKREEGKKSQAPTSKLQAYNNAIENLADLSANSDKLLERSVKAGALISEAAPNTAEALGNRAISGIQFLQSKIPKRPYDAIFPTQNDKPYQPSSIELAKFERYLQVVDNPLSVLEDIQAGTVTREHIEALQKVYPSIYSQIQQSVLKELQTKSSAEIPYNRKVQLSMLLNIPGDASLLGTNIAALQSNFQQPQQQQEGQGMVQPTAGAAQKVNLSNREASDTQAFLERRSKP